MVEFARAQIEAQRRLSPHVEAEIDNRAVRRHCQHLVLPPKVGLGGRVRPANAAVSFQVRKKWIRCCNQEGAAWQGRKAHDRIMVPGLNGTPLASPRISSGQNGMPFITQASSKKDGAIR